MAYKAISAVVASSNNVANPLNLTPVLPAARAVGDTLLAISTSRSISAVPTCATSGWAMWPGFPKKSATTSGGQIAVFWKEVVGGEGNPTITWTGLTTGTTGDSCQAVVMCCDFADNVTPSAGTSAGADFSSAHPSFPAITTDSASLVIGVTMKVIDVAYTGLPSAGYTERLDVHTTTGTGHGFQIATQPAAGAGTVAAGGMTASPATTARCFGTSIALRNRLPQAYPRTASDSWSVSDSAARIVNPIYSTLIDDFNRVDGAIYFESGAAIWADQHFDGSGLTSLAILANRLAGPPSKSSAYTLTEIDSAESCDIVIDCAVAPAVSPGEVSFYPLYTDPGSAFNCYGIHWVTPGNWYFGRYTNGSWSQIESNIGGGAAYSIAAGDSVWFAKRPSIAQPGFFELWVYLRKGSGPWVSVIGPTLGNYSPARSHVAIELADATQRWDNLRGGPVYVAPPLYEDIIDDFNRADGLLGTDWVLAPIAGGAATDLRVISNRLGNAVSGTQSAYTTEAIDNSSGNCDVLIDLSVNTGSSSFNLYFLVTNPGTATWSGYRVGYTGGVGSIALTRWANGSNVESLASGGTGGFTAGQMLWFRKRGSSLTLLRFSNGGWSILLHATDTDHNPAGGVCGIELTDTVTRWDNLRGGPLVVTGPPTYPVTASDSWSVSDSVTRGPAFGPSYRSEVLADNPISYWRLGNNVTIHDEIGAVPDVTAYGGWAVDGLLTGDPDASILFDGGDDIITFPNVAAHAVDIGTLELWVKTIEFGVGGGYRGMLVKSEAYGIFMMDNQLMSYDWALGGGGNRMSGVFLNDNLIHHVVMTFQSGVAGGSQFYVDGVAVGAPFQITPKYQSTSGFHVAANAGTQLFRGNLDELAFYGTVLSPARIAAHYQTGIGAGGGPAAPMFTRTASDTVAISDTATSAQSVNLVRGAADAVSINDAAIRAPATRIRPTIDAVSVSDAAVRAPGARARTANDSWARSDTATRAPAEKTRPAVDTVLTSDAAIRAASTRIRTAIDSWTGSDSATGVAQVTQGKTAVDSWSVADVVTRGPGIGGAPFSPADLTGLALWLDASTLGLSNGAPVASWTNPGSGPDPSTVGTPAPTFVTNMLNGLPVVHYAASEGRHRITSTGEPGAGTGVDDEWTFAYVGRVTGPIAGRVVNGIYPPANIIVGFWTGNEDVLYDNGFGSNTYKPWTPSWKLYSADGTTTPALEARLLSDGVYLGSAYACQGWGGSFGINGYSAVGAEESCDCEVAEVVMYSRKLSDIDRKQVEDYLRFKWMGVGSPPGGAAGAPMFTRTAFDAIALSDTATQTAKRTLTAADSVAFSDSAVGTKVVVRGTTDTVSTTDVANRAAAARARTAVDSWTNSDTAARAPATRVRPVIDAVAVSDIALQAATARVRGAVDSWSASDTAAGIKIGGSLKTAIDSFIVNDVAVRAAAARARGAVDSVATSDTTARAVSRARTAVDSWTRSDTATGVKVSLRGAVDTVVITDIAVRAPAAKTRIAVDSFTVGDSVARIAAHPGRTAVDSWTRSDVATVRKGYIRPTTDVITVSDTTIRAVFVRQRTAFDSITVSSTAQRGTFARQRTAVDIIVLSDMALRSTVVRIRTAVDAIAISDVAGAVMRAGAAPQMAMML